MSKQNPTPRSKKQDRFIFWSWFLTNAVFNLISIDDMPDDIETAFKQFVLIGGKAIFFNDRDGILRCLNFTDAGEVPIYPGQYIKMLVVNPVIGEYTFTAGEDNNEPVFLTMLDRCRQAHGLSSLINATADDLSDNDLTIRMAQFLKRMPTIFTAKTDNDYRSMSYLIKSIVDGETNIISQSPFNGAVQRLDGGQAITSPLSEFTEYQQYKLGQFYNMLGVNTVWNMKREAVAAAENLTSAETARYNIADIIDNLNAQFEKVNAKFGTDFKAILNVERAAEIADRLENTGNTENQVVEAETEEVQNVE